MNEDNFILEDVDRELTLDEKIKKIISEFEPKAVEYNSSDDGWSVKIQDQKSGMEFWVDVWVDTNYKDVETEWNQYIFDIQDDDDQLRSAIQNDNNVWDLASSEAVSYLEENNEIKQNEKGEWEVVYKTPDGEFYEIYEEDFNDETGDIEGAGRIWNVETGMEREFVFTFDVQGSAIYFNDFSTGDELDIRNENLINEIKSFANDHKDEIEHYITFTIDESKKVEAVKEDKTDEIIDAVKKAILRYDVDNISVDENGGIISVMYASSNNSFAIDNREWSANNIDVQKLVREIDKLDVGHCFETLDESKKIEEDKQEEYKYNGYTFIPMGNMKSNLNSFDMIRKNSKLDGVFNKEAGTYNYGEFYKVMPPVDIFKIPELDNILVMPGSNFLFEYSGDENTVTPMNELQSEEELRKPDEQGLIGTIEDKEVVGDLLDDEKDYSDIASKYGYSFNDYQLYNIATLYITSFTSDVVKQKIEDVLEDINYHSECAEIMEDAKKFRDSLFESKKVEAKTVTWDEIFKNAEGTTFGQKAAKVKDQARAEVEELMQKDGIDVDNLESVEDAIEEYVSKHNIKFLDNGCIANKKTEDVAINNGFNVTKYPEVQSLADDIANSIKDKKKITIDTVIDAIENWDGGDTSVFTVIAKVDKDLADKIDADEDNRYEAENQFLGLVEDTLNDMGITVYDEYDESKKIESRPDKERAISNYYNKIKRRLNIPKGGLKSKEEIIDYINKVDDAIGFLVIANSISFPNDRMNGNFNRYVSIAADELNDKYRWDNGKYLDDDDPKLVEPMKKELIKLVQDFELDKYYDLVNKFEAKSTKTEDVARNKTNADEINKTIQDKEFMNNLGITAEDVIKQVEISKKDFDELVNYVDNYKGTFGELYKELQGWNLGYNDVEKDDDNLFDCYYKSLLVTINVDNGKLSVSPHDVYVYPNNITKVDSDELFHLDFDKPIEFDKILKEDATQCGAVDGGRVSIFGEKEKKEEDNKYFSYVANRDIKETLNDLLSGNYDIMYDYNVENFVDNLIDYLNTLDDNKAHSIAWELNQACISAERSNRRASGTKPRKLIQALKSAKAFLDNNVEKKTESKELSKVEKLKLMDDAARSINDEEIIDLWLMCGVPDGASELDFEEIAEDEESYREIEAEFKKVMKLAVKDGLYQCPPQAFEFAKTYEPNLENID